MKLHDVKHKIDNFFDNISSDELFDLAINKYGFEEITNDLENQNFETLNVTYYNNFESNTVSTTFSEAKSLSNNCIYSVAA
jgi:hypothetical protein